MIYTYIYIYTLVARIALENHEGTYKDRHGNLSHRQALTVGLVGEEETDREQDSQRAKTTRGVMGWQAEHTRRADLKCDVLLTHNGFARDAGTKGDDDGVLDKTCQDKSECGTFP